MIAPCLSGNRSHDVIETLLIAIVLVVLIVFLFFRDCKIALAAVDRYPCFADRSIFHHVCFRIFNECTQFLAIVLATGLVVDDGIVVTENIYKKIEQGMDRWMGGI